MITITPDFLLKISQHYKTNKSLMNAQLGNIHSLAFPMNHWFSVFSINQKPLRIAHFLAQACCETQDFTSLTERTDGLKYEPTTRAGRIVGNKFPGDGPKYIGRGVLHLTGRYNYREYGEILHEDLINHPEKVALDPDLAVRTACEFWSRKHLNVEADRDAFDVICQRINGGSIGKDARRRALTRIKSLMNI